MWPGGGGGGNWGGNRFPNMGNMGGNMGNMGNMGGNMGNMMGGMGMGAPMMNMGAPVSGGNNMGNMGGGGMGIMGGAPMGNMGGGGMGNKGGGGMGNMGGIVNPMMQGNFGGNQMRGGLNNMNNQQQVEFYCHLYFHLLLFFLYDFSNLHSSCLFDVIVLCTLSHGLFDGCRFFHIHLQYVNNCLSVTNQLQSCTKSDY